MGQEGKDGEQRQQKNEQVLAFPPASAKGRAEPERRETWAALSITPSLASIGFDSGILDST